uniref:glycosyltransferase family 10 domain-containing protein n=1 Tax=Polynucleobacter sp. TaxID=2029855 RepID=UPI004047DCE6
MNTINICCLGVAKDFYQSLVPIVIKNLGYSINFTSPTKCDLLIFGPFFEQKKRVNWMPKPLRPIFQRYLRYPNENTSNNISRPVSLFITGENVRHDFQNCDFSISFDLGVESKNHLRMPYWMEMIDWSSEGVAGNQNPRFGKLLDLSDLTAPLGDDFLYRPQTAAIFASHLREPRRSVLSALKKHIGVAEFGKSFNPKIKNHNESDLIKFDELRKFAFNLCPENGMHPGYYTEKIPEAFMAGCLPITWADENIRVDFNPKAFINLAPMAADNFSELGELLHSKNRLIGYAEQPLLLKMPSITPLKEYLKKVLEAALS